MLQKKFRKDQYDTIIKEINDEHKKKFLNFG